MIGWLVFGQVAVPPAEVAINLGASSAWTDEAQCRPMMASVTSWRNPDRDSVVPMSLVYVLAAITITVNRSSKIVDIMKLKVGFPLFYSFKK